MPPKTRSTPNRDEDDSSESGTQEPTDAAGAGEGSSTRASPDAGILPPAPAGGAADVGEFMRAMTAMMETFSRQIATTPGDLDAYLAALGASDETALVQIVPIALTGDASRWRRLQQPFLSMADFRTRFREEFLPPDYEMRIRDELANRTQQPDESLVEYVRALQELYSRAEPSTSDAEKVARAIRQCHPRFKAYLRGRDFADLEALAREARTVQAGLLAELQYRPPPRAEESLEPRCAWAGRAADTHIESRTAYTAVAERGHGVTITPRALDPFAYEQRRRAANANSARVQTRRGGAVVNHRRGATGHDSRGNHDSPRFATDEVS
ncbi:uncharacterized protein ISCGN_006091, partial [Ixodes scapularis]